MTMKNLTEPPIYDICVRNAIYYVNREDKYNKTSKLVARISRNFNKAVLAFGKDTYELSEKNGEYT